MSELFPGVIRSRFVGVLLVILLSPVALIAALKPISLQFTVGVIVPLTYVLYQCFKTEELKFSNAISLTKTRFLSSMTFALALLLHQLVDLDYAIAWYMSFVFLILKEPIIYDILEMLGFTDPDNDKYYSHDDDRA